MSRHLEPSPPVAAQSSVAATAPAPPSDDVLDQLSVLHGRPRSVRPLPGGLTNRNYLVEVPAGRFVVRVSAAGGGALAIDREQEYRNTLIAAASGVGAPVLGRLPEHHLLVIGYLDGHTLTDDSFAVPGTVERVAEACRRLHDGERFVNDFNMFEVQERYLKLVLDRGFRLPTGYRDFEPQLAQLKRALATREQPTVACNNDLLAANFVDDGDRIRLIDYEYAGNNDPCFELGNIWSECHLDLDQLQALVTAYYGAPRPGRFARAQLQGLMSKYGWTLWGCIQQATGELDFDYWSWGLEKYESAVRMFRDPGFTGLLDEAARPD